MELYQTQQMIILTKWLEWRERAWRERASISTEVAKPHIIFVTTLRTDLLFIFFPHLFGSVYP